MQLLLNNWQSLYVSFEAQLESAWRHLSVCINNHGDNVVDTYESSSQCRETINEPTIGIPFVYQLKHNWVRSMQLWKHDPLNLTHFNHSKGTDFLVESTDFRIISIAWHILAAFQKANSSLNSASVRHFCKSCSDALQTIRCKRSRKQQFKSVRFVCTEAMPRHA